MTDKQALIVFSLFTTGGIMVFSVSICLFVLAWHNQSYSVLYKLWTLPGFWLMLYPIFYIERIKRNVKKT